MTPEYRSGNQMDGPDWPSCPYTEQDCMFQNLSRLLGANILGSLLSFIFNTEVGTRLTLQRNKEGFTLQVTGPLQKTTNKAPSSPHVLPDSLKMITPTAGWKTGQSVNAGL